MPEEVFYVYEPVKKYQINLRERLINFAVSTMKFLATLPNSKEFDVYRYQISKAAHSIGANYDEAQGAYSKADFTAKIGICLKEARETNFFYTVLNRLIQDEILLHLLKESNEIRKIFGKIMVKLRTKT
jgi:four helix bundle protein